MANFKIAINAGHYKYREGKRCDKSLDPNETREWVLNDRIVDKIEALLKNYTGYELLRIDDTTGEKDVDLDERPEKANEWGADLYLAVHHNAAGYVFDGGGITAYVREFPLPESVEWQKDLYNELIAETGLKGNRASPLYRSNLYEVYAPKKASVLLELGFMDSTIDTPIILTEKFADQCAKAIVNVIVRRAGLKKKGAAKEDAAPEEPVKETKKDLYRVRDEIILTDPEKARTTGNGIFTIVEEKTVNGTLYGRLKSGAGWIRLTHAEKI